MKRKRPSFLDAINRKENTNDISRSRHPFLTRNFYSPIKNCLENFPISTAINVFLGNEMYYLNVRTNIAVRAKSVKKKGRV